MKSSRIKTSTVLASFLLAACLSMRAEVKLPAIFSDGMVMQQQTNANLWGTATPNKKVTVTTGWNGKQYAVTADKNGSWKLSVSTPEAGGPYTITFDDGTPKTLNNILIGELWLCSGQSNMEMPMKGFKNQPCLLYTSDWYFAFLLYPDAIGKELVYQEVCTLAIAFGLFIPQIMYI